jgi:hypothetical protein
MADLGACLCFEDDSGQGLRPPTGRSWGCCGHTPVVRVTGTASKRVTPAALTATKPWGRARLIYHMHADRGHGTGRREGFTEPITPTSWTPRTGSPVARWWWCGTTGTPTSAMRWPT